MLVLLQRLRFNILLSLEAAAAAAAKLAHITAAVAELAGIGQHCLLVSLSQLL
jgi:hypothetical protein